MDQRDERYRLEYDERYLLVEFHFLSEVEVYWQVLATLWTLSLSHLKHVPQTCHADDVLVFARNAHRIHHFLVTRPTLGVPEKNPQNITI